LRAIQIPKAIAGLRFPTGSTVSAASAVALDSACNTLPCTFTRMGLPPHIAASIVFWFTPAGMYLLIACQPLKRLEGSMSESDHVNGSIAARQGLVELTQAETSLVSGGVICSRDPGMIVLWHMMTGGLISPSSNGAFTCWG
jgi:hypothetical protein